MKSPSTDQLALFAPKPTEALPPPPHGGVASGPKPEELPAPPRAEPSPAPEPLPGAPTYTAPEQPRYGNPLPLVSGLPAEEQHLRDALGAIVGHEYVITISLEQGHQIADTVRRAIRNDFARRCGALVKGRQNLETLGDDLDALLAPPAAPAPRARRPEGHEVRENELRDPEDYAAEIQGHMQEVAALMEEVEVDLGRKGVVPAEGDPEWLVFVAPKPVDLDSLPAPALTRAVGRHAAENAAAVATGVPVIRCFALPAWAGLRAGALPLNEHPLRRAQPADLGDAIALVMQGQIDRGDEEIAETKAATARLLGCTVPELEAKLAGEAAEKTREQATRRVESKARRQPAPKNAPMRAKGAPASVADGLRRLTPRQVELLKLVELDETTNRVIYTRDDHLPDWAALKQAVEALGGRWLGKTKKTKGGWAFTDEIDAADAIATALETGGIFDPKLLGFFATSDELADALVARLNLRPGDRVLEPSAGKGALALAARRACSGLDIVCVELVPEHAEQLQALGFKVIRGDFLKHGYDHFAQVFDVVVMNPPFGKGRPELHHLRHALNLLGTGGRLGAIMPNSLQFRQDEATVAMRADLAAHGALITKNPDDAFRAAGAMVKTVSLWLTK